MLIGYARVSTADQKLNLQNDALTQAECERIFTDAAGGASAERAGMEQALAFARKGDTLGASPTKPIGRRFTCLASCAARVDRDQTD